MADKTISEGVLNDFSVMVKKRNPKPNAKSHKLVTVQDIFNVLTEKNVNRFMKEFKQGMKVAIAMRELAKSISKAEGIEAGNDVLQMPSFTWIED